MIRLISSVVLLFVLSLVGCKKDIGKLNDVGAPSWVFSPDSVAKDSSEISAVGIGDTTKGGIKIQIAQAESDARANIASQILSEITRITNDATKNLNVANVEDVQKIFSQATEDVVRDMPLSGARRTHIWQDSKTDVMYIRMAIQSEKVLKHLNESFSVYERRLKQRGFDNDSNKLVSTFSAAVSDRFENRDIQNKPLIPIDANNSVNSKNVVGNI